MFTKEGKALTGVGSGTGLANANADSFSSQDEAKWNTGVLTPTPALALCHLQAITIVDNNC